jgi:hypothetical protein
VVIAGCDSNLKFHCLSATSPGCTHDSVGWYKSSLCQNLFLPKRLPSKYFAIGDDAFTNTNNFLTPFSGRNIGIEKDSYNYHISAMRQSIERAFGLLVAKWGIFGENSPSHLIDGLW